MLYLLVVVILQRDVSDTFYKKFYTLKECTASKKEALKHNNELTQITATCIKINKKL